MAENNLGNTQYFRTKPDQELQVKEVLDLVYTAMDEKGYNPVNQIVDHDGRARRTGRGTFKRVY